jgi:hypothetical protein
MTTHCFIVHDEADAALLERLELLGVVATDPRLAHFVRDAERIVIVDSRDPELRNLLVEIVAGAEICEMPLPAAYGSLTAWLMRAGDADGTESTKAVAGRLLDYTEKHARVIHFPDEVAPRSASWPTPMSPAARIGIVGELVDLVEAETEADPHAILADLLTRFGCALGRSPHFTVGGDRHGCNLFTAIVGDTGQGRKGTSAAFPRKLLEAADPTFDARTIGGLSSGEGIVAAVRDSSETSRKDRDGEPIADAGVSDKRLLAVESELARVLRAGTRQGSILLPILRQCWDGGALRVQTKDSYGTSSAHVSVIAHVTPDELRSLFSASDIAGGSGNRFLWIASRRKRVLPFGGSVDTKAFGRLAAKAADLLKAGQQVGEVGFAEAAKARWARLYCDLLEDEQRPGLAGQLLARAVVQVRRLAMIYALADGCRAVDVPHLEAAREVWRYSVRSIVVAFGDSTGNRIADRILGEARGIAPRGLTMTDVRDLFDRHVPADRIQAALQLLVGNGQLRLEKRPTAGRTAKVYFACGGGA